MVYERMFAEFSCLNVLEDEDTDEAEFWDASDYELA